MKNFLFYLDATRTSSWRHQTILWLVAVMIAGTMAGCSFRGTSKASPYLNGEIIHTTPNEWPRVQKRFPAMMFNGEGSTTKDDDSMARQFEARARKHGRASERVIKVEIKFIESQTVASQPGATDGEPRILSAGELNTYLRSIMRDPLTKTTSYPRMAGRAGHAMLIRSVVNQPMLASSQSRQLNGGGASTEVHIRYAPVGTILWICPVLTPSGRIHIATDLVISRIIGEEKFDGNPYPIVSAWRRAPALNIAEGEGVVIPGPIDESGRMTHLMITAAR